MDNKYITLNKLSEVKNSQEQYYIDLLSNIVSENLIEFPLKNSIKDNIYLYNNNFYLCINNVDEPIDIPNENFLKLSFEELLNLKKDVIEELHENLIGIIDFTNGKFDYWFKDNNIKIKDINSIINSGAGIVDNETNTLNGRVLEDSFYIGKSYTVEDIPYTNNDSSTIEKLSDDTLKITATNDGSRHIGIFYWGNYLKNNNGYIHIEIESKKDILKFLNPNFKRTSNGYIYKESFKDIERLPYCQLGFNDNTVAGDYFIITKRMFINGSSDEVNYSPIGTLIRDGSFSLEFENNNLSEYSIILKGKDNNKKYTYSDFIPYKVNYENYEETLYLNENILENYNSLIIESSNNFG